MVSVGNRTGSKDDQQLLVSKLDMMRHLLSCGLSKAKIRRLYNFINTYVSFQNLENKLKFEEEVRKITRVYECGFCTGHGLGFFARSKNARSLVA